MKAIKIEPASAPEIVEIDNTLEALQNAVNGYIEALRVSKKAVLIVNEEGKLKGHGICRFVYTSRWHDQVVGNILIVGVDGEEFCDLNKKQIDFFMKQFSTFGVFFKEPEDPEI